MHISRKAVYIMALRRVNMNIDEELLTQLDDYANKLHISRSSALAVLLSQLFQSQKTMETMNNLLNAYNEEKQKNGNG